MHPIQGIVDQATTLLTSIITDGDSKGISDTSGTHSTSLPGNITQTTNNGRIRRVVDVYSTRL